MIELQADGLRGSGRGLHIWNLDRRSSLLIRSNARMQARLSQNSCDLRILRWALTYITETSKHNFRGLVLRLFLQLSSCVFLSLPAPHSIGGYPPTANTPRAVWKRRIYGSKINKKVTLNEKSYLGTGSSGDAVSDPVVATAEDD